MPNEVDKWIRQLPQEAIEKELDSLRRQIFETRRKMRALEQALAVREAFSGPLTEDAEEEKPSEKPLGGRALRGREAIRRVIAETPEIEAWTIPEMLAAIHARGWTANAHAVRVNLSRMFRDGELGKAGTGIYTVKEREVPT